MTTEHKQLTVRELIELLQRCPPDAPVACDEGGCCTGNAVGVEIAHYEAGPLVIVSVTEPGLTEYTPR